MIQKYENLEKENIEKILKWEQRKLDEKLNEYFSIFFNENKVGYIRLSEHSGKNQIDDFYIFESYRNKGIGSMVLKTIIDNATMPLELVVLKVM